MSPVAGGNWRMSVSRPGSLREEPGGPEGPGGGIGRPVSIGGRIGDPVPIGCRMPPEPRSCAISGADVTNPPMANPPMARPAMATLAMAVRDSAARGLQARWFEEPFTGSLYDNARHH